jgi:hypothetical protein
MKISNVVIACLLVLIPLALSSASAAGQSELTTNIVDILPYIQRFGAALELGLPQPLTTNDVTRFQYLNFIQSCAVTIQKKWEFGFYVRERRIKVFTDVRHSMTALWQPEDIKPLLKPSRVSQRGAVALAWKYLGRLGYTPENMPVLSPKIKPWVWEPVNEDVHEPLPFFMIEWPWKEWPELGYLTVEVDGLRERINHFSILDTNKMSSATGGAK